MVIAFIAHLLSGLKPSSLVSPCTNSIFPAHPQTYRKTWMVWAIQWVIVPSKAFSMFLAGVSLPVGDLYAGGNEELGLYKASGRHKSLGFPASFSYFCPGEWTSQELGVSFLEVERGSGKWVHTISFCPVTPAAWEWSCFPFSNPAFLNVVGSPLYPSHPSPLRITAKDYPASQDIKVWKEW